MGSEQIDDDDALLDDFKSSLKPLTLADQLDEWCAYYMSIGVPYEEFWYGDYCKLKYYVMAHRLKKKMANEKLWLQGMYNYEATSVAIGNAFRDKGSPPIKYSQQPYDVVPKTEREQEIEAEKTRKKVIENLTTLEIMWRKQNEPRNENC